MLSRLFVLTITFFISVDALACSYCRSKVPAGAPAAAPAAPVNSGGGAMVVRGVAAAKSAVNFNDPIILSVDREEKVTSERGTYDMVVSPSEIYGGGSSGAD